MDRPVTQLDRHPRMIASEGEFLGTAVPASTDEYGCLAFQLGAYQHNAWFDALHKTRQI